MEGQLDCIQDANQVHIDDVELGLFGLFLVNWFWENVWLACFDIPARRRQHTVIEED